MSKQLSHWDYCQFLLVSQTNYTKTYYADRSDSISHDRVNCLLKEIKLTPKALRTQVKMELVLSENGCLLFDDTFSNKSHSFLIELVRRQWSGNAKKIYYCPLKSNRQVTEKETDGYARVDSLEWSEPDLKHGKSIYLKKIPKGHLVKLFRIVVSTHRADYVITNDLSQDSDDGTHQESSIRWKIEQFHREATQVIGIESC